MHMLPQQREERTPPRVMEKKGGNNPSTSRPPPLPAAGAAPPHHSSCSSSAPSSPSSTKKRRQPPPGHPPHLRLSHSHSHSHAHTHSSYNNKLGLLQPPRPIRSVHRPYRDTQGQIHPNRVALLPVGLSWSPAYVLEAILDERPYHGTTLYLATPARPPPRPHRPPPHAAADDKGSPMQLLAACGGGQEEEGSVVIKAIPLPSSDMQDDPLHEVAVMQHLAATHNNDDDTASSSSGGSGCAPPLIPLLDCMQDDQHVYLVLPYLAGEDLFSRVKGTQGQGLPEAEARQHLRDMVDGLLFLKQACGLAHHDVSLDNFVFSDAAEGGQGGDDGGGGGGLQLIDFGSSVYVPAAASGGKKKMKRDRQQHHPIFLSPRQYSGKPAYLAPEMARLERYVDPFAADVWSLGVCLYTMLVGRPLYNTPHGITYRALEEGKVEEVLREVCTAPRGDDHQGPPLVLPPCAMDLLSRMLHPKPSKRPSLEVILTHPFLTNSDGASSRSRSSWGKKRGISFSLSGLARTVKGIFTAARGQ